MTVVTISTSKTAAQKAVSEIQTKLIKDGFEISLMPFS